jgi:hypothetical protein
MTLIRTPKSLVLVFVLVRRCIAEANKMVCKKTSSLIADGNQESFTRLN